MGQVPWDLFVPEASSGDENQCCHLCWWRHPGSPSGHHPRVLLKRCPSAVDASEGQELPFGGVRVGGSQDENQGNEGLVVVGYGNEQHPSPRPSRAAEQHPWVIILTRKAFSTQQLPLQTHPSLPPKKKISQKYLFEQGSRAGCPASPRCLPRGARGCGEHSAVCRVGGQQEDGHRRASTLYAGQRSL